MSFCWHRCAQNVFRRHPLVQNDTDTDTRTLVRPMPADARRGFGEPGPLASRGPSGRALTIGLVTSRVVTAFRHEAVLRSVEELLSGVVHIVADRGENAELG